MVAVIIIAIFHLTCAMYLVLSLYCTVFSFNPRNIPENWCYDYPYFIRKETEANKDSPKTL